MKKIVLMLNCLDKIGGTERATVDLANILAQDPKYEVTILSIYKNIKNESTKYSLNSNIKVEYVFERIEYLKFHLNFYRFFEIFIKNKIGKILDKLDPHFVLYTQIKFINPNNSKYKKLLMVHTSYEAYIKGKLTFYKFKKYHSYIDSIVFLSQDDLNKYVNDFKRDNGCFIYNSCSLSIKQRTNHNNKKILFLGRLDNKTKQIDHAIKAFSNIVKEKKVHDWEFHIYGSGKDEEMLKELVANQKMNEKILFKGVSDDLNTLFTKYDILVLTSDYEGLPMSLIEGASSGLALISYDSSPGIREIIEHEKSGYIVAKNDLKKFELSLYDLMQDKSKRIEMGKRGLEIMKDKFHISVIKKKWDSLFNSL